MTDTRPLEPANKSLLVTRRGFARSESDFRTAHWVSDKDVHVCSNCYDPFTVRKRKHHCRSCGLIFCADCTHRKCALPELGYKTAVRVCEDCHLKRDAAETRSLAEDLDVKETIVESLKRALHQKVELLDEVKSFLIEMSEQADEVSSTAPSADASGFEDDLLAWEEEDESLEGVMAKARESFSKLFECAKSLQTRCSSQDRVVAHLEVEGRHAAEHLQNLGELLARAQRESEEHAKKAALLQAEVQRLEQELNTRPLCATPRAAMSPGPPPTRGKGMCSELLRRICWWPLFPTASPRGSPRELTTPMILGHPQEPILVAMDTPQRGRDGLCCRKQAAHPLID